MVDYDPLRASNIRFKILIDLKSVYPNGLSYDEIIKNGVKDGKEIDALEILREINKLEKKGLIRKSINNNYIKGYNIQFGGNPPRTAYFYFITPRGFDYRNKIAHGVDDLDEPKLISVEDKINSIDETDVAQIYQQINDNLNEKLDLFEKQIQNFNTEFNKKASELETRVNNHEIEIKSTYRKMIEIFGIFVAIFSITILSVNAVINIAPGMQWDDILIYMFAIILPVALIMVIFIILLEYLIVNPINKNNP